MTKIGHVIYKADDLHQSVRQFRSEGFDVEYGQAQNPRNAVIYFSSGPYLEIISGVFMPRYVRVMLGLIGQRRQVSASDSVALLTQGYTRIVFETESEKFAVLKETYRSHGMKTITCPMSRVDSHGRHLSCQCLVPDEWGVPMFVTPFATDTHRQDPHPNGITRIDEVSLEGSETVVDICRRAGVDPSSRIKWAVGDSKIAVRFA